MTRFAVVLAVGVLVLGGTAQAGTAPPARWSKGVASDSLKELVKATGGKAGAAATARYAYLRKLDSHLQELASARARGAALAGVAAREGVVVSGGDALVDVYVNGDLDAAARALRAQGMIIEAVSRRRPQRMVEGRLPVAALTRAAGLARARAVVAVLPGGTDTGSVLSEGDAAHNGPAARALGVSGEGVKVGVISDSIDQVGGGVSDSQSTGDLPGPASSPPGSVTVLADDVGSSDEGRAMSEIIFDTAPGLRQMYFSSGTASGPAGKADSIDALVDAGVQVIADDIFYLSEPFFQDGIVAQAADRAKGAGVAYLASAGNRSRRSWEGTYTPTTDPLGLSDSANDFDPSGGEDAIQTVGTYTATSLTLMVQWDEPWGAAETDLAVDLYTISGGTPTYLATVDSDNLATGLPREVVNLNVPATSTIGISIRRFSGDRDPFIKYIDTAGPIAEYPTSSDTINPDATSAAGAITVAAVAADDPGLDTPETFSSRGPKTRLFDVDGNRLAAPEVRQKPDIAAADKVSTTVPGFAPFFGTSAATPSAAGIVALMVDANPALTPDAVRAVLRDTIHTNECTADAILRPDNDCGFGFELADGAVVQALDTTPPAVTPTVTGPAGANGFYTGDVSVSFAVSDPQSPVFKRDGCDPQTVTTDGTVAVPCSVTSVGGTTNAAQTIKRDASPPTAPTFTGIAAQAYTLASVPPPPTCTATDPHSGLAGCAVTGYSAALGTHTLTATAANGAGQTSTSTLTYSVAPNPAAASGLRKLGRLSRKRLKRKGLTLRFTAGAPSTAVIAAVRKGSKTLGRKAATVTAGAARVRVKLSRKGRRKLRRARKVVVTLTATAPGFTATTLKQTVKLKT